MERREYAIKITGPAKSGLKRLAKKLGKPLFLQLKAAIDDLKFDPELKTQELGKPLSAFRSLHVGRSRVVVRISDVTVTVFVVAAGWHESGDRDDVYQQVIRAIESGSLDVDELQ